MSYLTALNIGTTVPARPLNGLSESSSKLAGRPLKLSLPLTEHYELDIHRCPIDFSQCQTLEELEQTSLKEKNYDSDVDRGRSRLQKVDTRLQQTDCVVRALTNFDQQKAGGILSAAELDADPSLGKVVCRGPILLPDTETVSHLTLESAVFRYDPMGAQGPFTEVLPGIQRLECHVYTPSSADKFCLEGTNSGFVLHEQKKLGRSYRHSAMYDTTVVEVKDNGYLLLDGVRYRRKS